MFKLRILFIESIIYFDTCTVSIFILACLSSMMSKYDCVNKRRPTKVRWQVGDHVKLHH